MRMNVNSLLAAAACCVVAGGAQAATLFDTYYYGGHKYEVFIDAGITWGAAAAAAAASGGYLANLTTAGESLAVAPYADAGYNLWLGGAEGADNVYSWQAGPEAGLVFWNNGAVPGVYSNFNAGEPNNSGGDQDYLRYNSGGTHTWDDYGPIGSDIAGYLVESAIPEPASWALMIAGFGFAGAALRRRRGLATA